MTRKQFYVGYAGRSLRIIAVTFAAVLLFANQAKADPINMGPPSGAILDLHGTAIPHSYTQYSVAFVATSASTNLSFAFREDPAFLFLDDVTLNNDTTATPVPVVNGDFELGPLGGSAPTGWTYLNSFGAAFGGFVSDNNPHTGSNNYYDGAVQAYDGITQAIATTIGNTYTVKFWLSDNGPYDTFSRLSTNGNETGTGGNGVDLLVYAGDVPTAAVPEPASLALLGLSALGMAGYRWRRREAA